MQPERENNSDLEYLAQLGFEKVKTGEKDIHELQQRVRNRAFSYNNGTYFGLISVLTGMFLGISVFFMYYNVPVIFPASNAETTNVTTAPTVSYSLTLDTLTIIHENFTRQLKSKLPEGSTLQSNMISDTLAVTSMPMATLSAQENIKETQLKYIPNAPVIFLHDIKITDYSNLYFARNRFIKLETHEGIDPSYANASELGKNDNVLAPQGHYYLHQAISDAMLYFSRKEYARCLTTLRLITEINPDDINCSFYSGMCYYYQKDFKNARKQFETCINNPNNTFLNEARFYKALCLYYNGSPDEAVSLLKEISEEGSFYSEKAMQFLKQD